MDAAAELGRNPVCKHHIQPEYGDEEADARRDCRTPLVSINSEARTRTRTCMIFGSNCQANDGPDWDCRALPLNHSITMTDFLLSGLVAYSSYYLHKTQTGGSMAPDVTPRWLAPLPCDMQQAVIQVITQSICSGVLPLSCCPHISWLIFFLLHSRERADNDLGD